MTFQHDGRGAVAPKSGRTLAVALVGVAVVAAFAVLLSDCASQDAVPTARDIHSMTPKNPCLNTHARL
jgi:hypothetical protein